MLLNKPLSNRSQSASQLRRVKSCPAARQSRLFKVRVLGLCYSGITCLSRCSHSEHRNCGCKGDLQMKTSLRFGISAVLVGIMGAACFGQRYTQTNLVSNTAGAAPVTDPKLINSWGLSRSSGSPWWISDNATGISTLYDGAGVKQSLVVTIPPADPTNKNTPTGSPTRTIFNGSQTDFLLAPGKPAVFLFSTIDGTIAGGNPNLAVAQGAAPPSTHAVTVVRTTDGSVYTGLTSAFIDGKPYLYAANFTKGRVDVYDNAFRAVDLSKRHFEENSSDHDAHFDN